MVSSSGSTRVGSHPFKVAHPGPGWGAGFPDRTKNSKSLTGVTGSTAVIQLTFRRDPPFACGNPLAACAGRQVSDVSLVVSIRW